jgi:hypothetical protein
MQQQNWSLAQLAKRDILDKPAVAAPPAPGPTPADDAAAQVDAATQADDGEEDDGTKALWLRGAQAIFKEQLYATR